MVARFILLVSILAFCSSSSSSSNIITPGSSLSADNISHYWSSDSGQFALGFYPKRNGFALGIWYAKNTHTLVWTAKRNDPPFPIDTKLLLTIHGKFILQNNRSQELPITDSPSNASSASLLDSGNFVLYDSNSSVIWQSFDFPTDTLLPGQRLVAGQNLISSVSDSDHSTGKFQLVMQTDGNLVQYPVDGPNGPNGPETAYYNSGTYTAGNNVSLNLDGLGRLYLVNSSGFTIKNLNIGLSTEITRLYRLTLDADGLLKLYSRDSGDEIGDWRIDWSPNQNKCDPKGLCGPNEWCNVKDDVAFCTCFPGFDKINQEENFGCKRTLTGSTNNCLETNDVQELGIIWLDNSYSVLYNVSKYTCGVECSRDCGCEAAIYKDQQCHKQVLPLRFGRVNLPNDQGIVALVKVGGANFTTPGAKKGDKKDQVVLILGLTFLVAAILVLVISGLLICKFSKRGYKHTSSGNSGHDGIGMDDDIMLRSFKYRDLEEATNGFEEELGRGGFGTVFKGVLSKGESAMVNIAVKRIEIQVAESEREFLNEVKIIGKTHHRNLIQLLGYCNEGTNRLLVYEYMSNGSLADFLFNKLNSEENHKPKWEERLRIILDIARGIMYLHEECKTQIIHCDIKPENILMDEKGRAMIADFGVSKLLMSHQSKTRTRMRGTRGYVAPEWHRNVPVTTKVDVYSFGIMLLEIVCCRRSLDSDADVEDEVVLSEWVYDCFEANEVEKVVRDDEVAKTEVERVVKVGLWCIQNEPSLRPLMKKVVLMLEGTVDIPIPPSPASFLSSL